MNEPDTAAYRRYYREGGSAQFDQLRLDGATEIESFASLVLERMSPPGRILDIGCGTGRYGAALSSAGFAVVGVDASPDQLRHCRGIEETLLADATGLPFSAGSFDACILVLMLHQLTPENQVQALRECSRVLRKTGLIAIKTCSQEDLQGRPFGTYFPSALAINQRRYPALEALVSGLQDAGIGDIEIEPTHSVEARPVEAVMDAMSGRHNTTLASIPAEELESGLKRLEVDLDGQETIEIDHHHTIILGRRS